MAPSAVTDVVVAGSGAAGLVTALTAAVGGRRVMLCERSSTLGGTSAVSGGRVWAPGNHFQADPEADRRAAATYLDGIFDPRYAAMTEAFLGTVPAMLRFVEEHTPHRFVPCGSYPDYHPGRPGATLGGRCLDAEPLATKRLTPLVELVRRPPGYVPITHAEWERWRLPSHYDHELLRKRRRNRVVTGGPALVAALLHGAVEAGVTVHTGHRVTDVTVDEGGRLAVTVDRDGAELKPLVVETSALVLATGGYDQDGELRRRHLPPALAASASGPGNRGDALAIATGAGAELENLGAGWWMPLVSVPDEELEGVPYHRSLVRERGAPRQIIVDRTGRRFADEAAPYHEFVKAMLGAGLADAFLVFDEGFRRRYPLPGADHAVSGCTVAELAGRLGVDPDGLAAQITRWNAACAAGTDGEFGRGGNPYDRYHGDPELPGNPNLGPLDEPPFHAVRVRAGTIGSKGGPVTDTDGRVLERDNRPITGLYAVGNAAAFWTADGYPGPGATLGAGMTLGHRAGLSTLN